MPSPEITVVMPVYNINTQTFLREAVESILKQTFGDFELLVIEGGSTDGSREIIESYGDARIRIVDHPIGPSMYEWFVSGLNRGVAEARSSLIARMDGDDVSLPLRFERQMATLAEHPELVLLGCGMDYVTESGATSKRVLRGGLWYARREGDRMIVPPIPHGSAMFRKGAFLKAGGYRSAMVRVEDTDMWLRLAELGPVALLQERLFLYRINRMSITSCVHVKPGYYNELAQRFSTERLKCGSDSLQREEPLPPPPPAGPGDGAWEATQRNSLVASVEGRRAEAVAWAVRGLASHPLSNRGWRRLAKAICGRT